MPVGTSGPRGQLDSWKEIAVYLNRGVRTVQRWEREAGLPVRRLATEKRGAVYAYISEIDAWRESRSTLLAGGDDPETTVPAAKRKRTLSRRTVALLASTSVLAGLAVALLWPHAWRIGDARRLTFEGNIITPALAPDGKRIAFSSLRQSADGHYHVWLKTAPDTAPTRLTSLGAHEIEPVFSPDSERLLFSATGEMPDVMAETSNFPQPAASSLYESDLAGHARLIAEHAASGSYSPDGRWIAYLRAGADRAGLELGVMPASGGAITELKVGLSKEDALLGAGPPVWSPDSRFLLLNARTNAAPEFEWWLVSMSTHSAIRTDCTAQMVAAGAPLLGFSNLGPRAWLPDGTVLAKTFGETPASDVGVWSARFNVGLGRFSSIPRRISAPMVNDVRWWSIAGRQILFSGGKLQSGLTVLPFDLENARPLGPPRSLRTGNPGGYAALSVSRNGRVLAFVSRQGGLIPQIFALDLETGRETPVDHPLRPKMYPAITPDGSRVAFSLLEWNSKRPIYIADTDTGRSRLISENAGRRPIEWSPDGRWLLLGRTERVSVMDIGSAKIQDILESAHYRLSDPSVSPDSRWISVTTSEGPAFVAPFRGAQPVSETEWRRYGNDGERVLSAFWAPSGRRLYWLGSVRREPASLKSQRFDPEHGLVGVAEEVYKLNLPLLMDNALLTRLAAGPDQIIEPLVTIDSDLWIARLEGGR